VDTRSACCQLAASAVRPGFAYIHDYTDSLEISDPRNVNDVIFSPAISQETHEERLIARS
jgi:hypothetical protein